MARRVFSGPTSAGFPAPDSRIHPRAMRETGTWLTPNGCVGMVCGMMFLREVAISQGLGEGEERTAPVHVPTLSMASLTSEAAP